MSLYIEMPRYGFDFGPLPGRRRRPPRSAAFHAAIASTGRSLSRIENLRNAARRSSLARTALTSAARAFGSSIAADVGRRAYNYLSSSSDTSVHWSDSDTPGALIGPSRPIPAPQAGPSYRNNRPPALNLNATQLYRDHPTVDPPVRIFGRPPGWLYISNTPEALSQPKYSPKGPKRKRRAPHFNTLSPRSRSRTRRRIRRFLKVAALKTTLSSRAARPNRHLDYLRTSLRQIARAVLHLRKRYILAHSRDKPAIRRALARVKHSQWRAKRRYRHAIRQTR